MLTKTNWAIFFVVDVACAAFSFGVLDVSWLGWLFSGMAFASLRAL